ncbi:MAG: 1,4-dihydroxy-2-naphthoate polyprenyltransferase [Sedimenticola sp.]
MPKLYYWLLAIRPKTLTISISPVAVGSCLGWAESGQLLWIPALAALLAALLIQIGTNLHNDAADFERGADGEERLGPPRASAQGWFTPREVKQGALLSFSLAFGIGIYLAWVGGWPIVIIGLLSLAAGYAYTGGPLPIAYNASGELFVFLFFGLAAVMGSYYLQAPDLSLSALVVATAIGLLAAAVLLVNNYRDLDSDRKADKLTLCHHLGRESSRRLYSLLMLLPFLAPLWPGLPQPSSWTTILALPWALLLVRRFHREAPGPRFNSILAQTAQLQLVYSLLLCAGILAGMD